MTNVKALDMGVAEFVKTNGATHSCRPAEEHL
jgi:hypothetical protein